MTTIKHRLFSIASPVSLTASAIAAYADPMNK
jgi:hypothetical protein